MLPDIFAGPKPGTVTVSASSERGFISQDVGTYDELFHSSITSLIVLTKGLKPLYEKGETDPLVSTEILRYSPIPPPHGVPGADKHNSKANI